MRGLPKNKKGVKLSISEYVELLLQKAMEEKIWMFDEKNQHLDVSEHIPVLASCRDSFEGTVHDEVDDAMCFILRSLSHNAFIDAVYDDERTNVSIIEL